MILRFLLLCALFITPIIAHTSPGASLYLVPDSGIVRIGDIFTLTLRVSTDSDAINASEARIVFPTQLLEVVNVSKAGSIFALWPQEPAFSGSGGTISFAGGLPSPGFKGTAGKLITITFRAKNAGTAKINFASGAVLADDGFGTNILAGMFGATYTISGVTPITPPPAPPTIRPGAPSEPVIFSPTHPESNKWYPQNKPEFQWILPRDITTISYVLDQNPDTIPDSFPEELSEETSFENVPDGVSYFHLKFKNLGGWGATSRRKIQVDITPPERFEIDVKEGVYTTEHEPTITFEAKDATSGVDYYELIIDGGNVVHLEKNNNEIKLPYLEIGVHKIEVRAYDLAGNMRSNFLDVEIIPEIPRIDFYPEKLCYRDPLAVHGTAQPDAKVLITFNGFQKEVRVNKDGKWYFIYEEILDSGRYELFAELLRDDGAKSEPSEKVVITILPDFIICIIVLLSIILLLIILLIIIWHKCGKKKKRRKTNR